MTHRPTTPLELALAEVEDLHAQLAVALAERDALIPTAFAADELAHAAKELVRAPTPAAARTVELAIMRVEALRSVRVRR
ncbi:MAG: hypothetical protein KF764_16935 [Labilithrix sp.]|nr:hypothetical protein [Labilithrix sp.]